MGKLFHSCGPAYLKDLSPSDLNWGLHGLIKHLSLDLRDRVLTYGTIKSHRLVQYVDMPHMLEYNFKHDSVPNC